MTSVQHVVLVQPRYVAVPKALIGGKYEALWHFQVAERANEYALKKGLVKEQRVPLYEIARFNGQEYFRFPRGCLPQLMKIYAITQLEYWPGPKPLHPVPTDIVPKDGFALGQVQSQVCDFIFAKHYTTERVRKGDARCTVELTTGGGKTFVAIGCFLRLRALHPGLRILYLTPTHVLAAQAEDNFRDWLQGVNTTTEASQYCDVCILNIDAALGVQDDAFFDFFSFVVYDEVPTFCTPSRRQIFYRSKARYSLGMTAEPNSRFDHLDPIWHAHLGDLVTPRDYDAISIEIPVKLIQHEHRSQTGARPMINKTSGATMFLPSVEHCLSDDGERTAKILDLSVDLYRRGRPHFIWSHHILFAQQLHKQITTRVGGLAPLSQSTQTRAPRVILLIGETGNLPETHESIRTADIIVATYGIGTYGLSIKHMTAMILAHPPYGIRLKQIVGRIQRPDPANPAKNNIIREVHTFADYGQRWLMKQQAGLREYFGLQGGDKLGEAAAAAMTGDSGWS